ncbi:hypothetical protein F1559_000034 [Cyanidiococcus yangmingshanensis]|uniref:Uncharacterized protein n=1 Tax=Cyanidiococcus yangmingshanensis TaxID=2690220 RepID=A0A7J7IJW1_9RHOD|nr:hypothetical protein F1559_000034 [Cyanidiococcus yangmingshanensis]
MRGRVRLRFQFAPPEGGSDSASAAALLERSDRSGSDAARDVMSVPGTVGEKGTLTAEALWELEASGRIRYRYRVGDRITCRLHRAVPLRWVVTVFGSEPVANASLVYPVYSIDDTLVYVRFALPIHTAFGRFVVIKCQGQVCVLEWSASDVWRGEVSVRDGDLIWQGELEYQVVDLPEAQARQVTAEDAIWNDCAVQRIKLEAQQSLCDMDVETLENSVERSPLAPEVQVLLWPGVLHPPWPPFVSNAGDPETERMYAAWFQHSAADGAEHSNAMRVQLEDTLRALVSEPEWNALQRFSHRMANGLESEPSERSKTATEGSTKKAYDMRGSTHPSRERLSRVGSGSNSSTARDIQSRSRWRSLLFCLIWFSAVVCALYVYKQNFGIPDTGQKFRGTGIFK